MAEEFNAITDGTYVFFEGDVPNQFYFRREDGEALGDIDHEPLDFYHAYIMQKMMDGEIEGMVANNILTELSTDGTCMRITVKEIAKGPIIQIEISDEEEQPKKVGWFKRIKQKLFGK